MFLGSLINYFTAAIVGLDACETWVAQLKVETSNAELETFTKKTGSPQGGTLVKVLNCSFDQEQIPMIIWIP